MPPRFVEVLDVATEASGLLSQLAERASEFASDVRLNITQYINVTTGEYDVDLLGYLAKRYNVSSDDVIRTLSALNLTNTTMSTVPPPSGMAGWLIVAGMGLLASRAALVRLQATRYVRRFGHAHREHAE